MSKLILPKEVHPSRFKLDKVLPHLEMIRLVSFGQLFITKVLNYSRLISIDVRFGQSVIDRVVTLGHPAIDTVFKFGKLLILLIAAILSQLAMVIFYNYEHPNTLASSRSAYSLNVYSVNAELTTFRDTKGVLGRVIDDTQPLYILISVSLVKFSSYKLKFFAPDVLDKSILLNSDPLL